MTFLVPARSQFRRLVRFPFLIAALSREQRFRRSGGDYLALCAIFKDEAPFLDEWLRFHRSQGVSHFFLYNNFSTDHFGVVLQPWIDSGWLTLTDWPFPVGQLSAYRNCIRKASHRFRWLGLIDIDEFLFPTRSNSLPDVLVDFEDLPAVEVWQLFYGSNGHCQRPAMPVREAYVRRAGTERTTVKSIINPRMVFRVGIHQSRFVRGSGLDTSRRTVGPGVEPQFDVLRINHYWSRSLEDLRNKVQRGDASTANARDLDWHLAFEKELNAELDDCILQRNFKLS